jgi:hypothetical protein
MYVQVTNVHALVRGLQNRTRQTSMRSGAVRKELRVTTALTDLEEQEDGGAGIVRPRVDGHDCGTQRRHQAGQLQIGQ